MCREIGLEFIARSARDWLEQVAVKTRFIAPGTLWETGNFGSLGGKLPACEILDMLLRAKVLNQSWRVAYNTWRLHSALVWLPLSGCWLLRPHRIPTTRAPRTSSAHGPMVPAALRHGNLPAWLALSVPHPQWICLSIFGKGTSGPDPLKVVYRAARASNNVPSVDARVSELAPQMFSAEQSPWKPDRITADKIMRAADIILS